MLMRTIYVVLVKQTTAKMNIAALILLILVNCGLRCICSTTDGRLLVKITLVKNASALGAFCLDGSLPAYHFHPGFGDGARNWILAFEGGGWCNDLPSCLERAKTRRGSTLYMNKLQTFSGILSNNASLNPDFYNWNRVKLRYCDGGSFSGDAEFINGTSTLYFRGKRIWEAIIQDLLPKGLGQAHKALLSGCSAGGLSAFHQCDNFAKILPSNSTVKCLSDAGFFLDEQDISMNRTMRSFYAKLVTLQGSVMNLNNNCTRTLSDPKLCFFPQYALKFIKTPLFILNTAYDVFQLNHILVPPSADRGGQWKSCKLNTADCNANQIDILQGFRSDMLAALRSFFRYSSSGGMFINSCFAHCQSESQDTWLAADSPTVHYKTIARTVGDWYFGRGISKEIDCPYPCDHTCHNLIQTAPDDRRFLSYQSHSDLDGCEDCPKHHEDKNAATVLKPMLGIRICLIYMVAFFF